MLGPYDMSTPSTTSDRSCPTVGIPRGRAKSTIRLRWRPKSGLAGTISAPGGVFAIIDRALSRPATSRTSKTCSGAYDEQIHIRSQEIFDEVSETLRLSVSPALLDDDVLAFDVTQLMEPPTERIHVRPPGGRRSGNHDTDLRDLFSSLRPGTERCGEQQEDYGGDDPDNRGRHSLAHPISPPNGVRLSGGVLKKIRSTIYARRQLQALVRRPGLMAHHVEHTRPTPEAS